VSTRAGNVQVPVYKVFGFVYGAGRSDSTEGAGMDAHPLRTSIASGRPGKEAGSVSPPFDTSIPPQVCSPRGRFGPVPVRTVAVGRKRFSSRCLPRTRVKASTNREARWSSDAVKLGPETACDRRRGEPQGEPSG
jgi:hypothetical protein